MSWHDIRLLYVREMRSALRERGIVVNSILLPLFLYPTMLWLTTSGISLVRGQEERLVSRIALVGSAAPSAAELRRRLAGRDHVEVVEPPSGEVAAALRDGRLDAVAEVLPVAGDTARLEGNFRVIVTYDASKDRGDTARRRLEDAVDEFRARWVKREADARGITPADWAVFRLERRNVASERELGAFILGLLAPLLMVIMVAVGTFYPAVDATAGERERSTWETLMSTAASRGSILTAKYLYVATLGTVAGLLNLTAITLTMRTILAPLMSGEESSASFAVPLLALPLLVGGTALLALFMAAGMMLFASFARTFKEGQSMVGPFYVLCILPPLFAQSPDMALTPRLALVPIVNVTLLFRAALTGSFPWALAAETLVVEAVTVALLLALARAVLGFEDVVLGSYSGSLPKLLKERWRRRRALPRGVR